MTTVLIVEDDDAIRMNITRLLKLEGFNIMSATNGREALERARSIRPDVIVSDVSMPEMDGLQLIQAIRADKSLATVPVMLLTALDDRASMRRGMSSGADDYLAKPFTRAELLEALQGLLRKKAVIDNVIESELTEREASLRQAFMDSLGGTTSALQVDRFAIEVPEDAAVDQVAQATVLFSDIRNFTSIAEKLSSAEVAELLTEYFERSCGSVLKNGGKHLKFIGDGLMAIFTDSTTGSPLPAARRAVSAALAMALTTNEFRAWLHDRFSDRGLPDFAIGVGLYSGEVTICRLGTLQNKEITPIGDTVNTAARLEAASKDLGWTVVAGMTTLELAGEGVQTGATHRLAVRGKNLSVDVAEITGLVTNLEDMRHGMATLTERAAEIRDAVKRNSEITARAFKEALESKLSALKDYSFAQGDEPLRLKGYRVVRKIGSGGMTEVYLAVREEDNLPIVLKVLMASGQAASEHLSRFIQEYALLSKIDHPNVIRIYDQGFTDDHAYIAMEYFERGDLRSQFAGGMSQQRVIDITTQVAGALAAIHGRGVVHRDLKPENLMLHADGSVALADFGIAKSLGQTHHFGFNETSHGDVVGTPYYLSPEQAAGRPITPQSDFYSLGVMVWEMLTGQRPFVADSLEQLLQRHMYAPTPALPAEHAALQPLVDRLMQKDPASRYATAGDLLSDLRRMRI
ncbi:MAG: response regulator [Comamonadaceae bacterium]|nr:MAG: response regulator [Comamonadaceae bacterium]